MEFMIKFKEIVYNHAYLNYSQKLHYLQQHVLGIAKRGYILSLKRLKYKSREKSYIAEAHLTKVMKGKQIANYDDIGLIESYYSLSGCIITLHQLSYESSAYSTDTLCQTIRHLRNKFYSRWGRTLLQLKTCKRTNTIRYGSLVT